ncbi:Fe(3+) dicitrate ABC transporter substrate-binding protein FecB [Serratia symbiotica]|uniref:Fe(3+) dicitrate ABC transporter substrate-binding protein FecB n=1 Tax=Serratia symbiotica TaxID=138074 RepID=UPI00209162DA|nr:Fe(3+) dicitrate ABC transporter substrate-binding protein FecB [Serratia symbiotica]USS95939.1 Fe(3+) dicitrate ABC transporter substrate-binding protein FecB [Serratia symbiotica]
MFTRFICVLLSVLLPGFSIAQAISVQGSNWDFTLERPPGRVVVLELSFVDALAAAGVSPIGVADDNDPKRILPAVRDHLKPWQSVGTRAQPGLETIAALKPDLIIADSARHAGIYRQLSSIAPTLMLKSRNETYEQDLQSAAVIGKVLGKNTEMRQRLALHRQRMQQFASQLPKGLKVVFGTSREQQFNLHSRGSYTGSVLTALGMAVSAPINQAARSSISLEQLLAINPAWLIVAHYRPQSIVHDWQQDPLWQMLTAAQNNQVAVVDSNSWARMRGIFAAEHIASDLVAILHHRPVPPAQ